MAVYKRIAQRIAENRRIRGLSQTALANACGWSQTRLSGYEQATRKISIDDATTLAKTLGMQPGELIFGHGEQGDWMTPQQKKLIDLYNRLPTTEQERMIAVFEARLAEIEQYVDEYLRKVPKFNAQ